MSDDDKMMRLDLALVARGFTESRAKAQEAIKKGGVTVDGDVVQKSSFKVKPDQIIEAEPAHPYVSRGGLKLAAALDAFDISPEGRICLDIGASTGGFTDVLLRGGATHVYAVDVGRGQFHPSLKSDPRATSLEALDARRLDNTVISRTPDLLVCDASFIMLEKVLETPLKLLSKDGEGVALFKPQFQVGPENVGRGGVVTDKAATDRAWTAFEGWLKGVGWSCRRKIPSPIKGGDGNREFLAYLVRGE